MAVWDHHTRPVAQGLDPTLSIELTLAEREPLVGAIGMGAVILKTELFDHRCDDGGTSGGLGHLDLSFLVNLL